MQMNAKTEDYNNDTEDGVLIQPDVDYEGVLCHYTIVAARQKIPRRDGTSPANTEVKSIRRLVFLIVPRYKLVSLSQV